jgi:hypothetical protein
LNIFTSVDELPKEWDEFLPSKHFLSTEQLRLSERSKLPDLKYIYILATKGGKPMTAAYFQVLMLGPQHINPGQVSKGQYLLWQVFSKLRRPPLLVAGHLFRHDICSFYWDTSMTAFEAFQYYRSSIDAAMKKSCAMAVLVKDTSDELVNYFQHFAPQYFLLRNDISMELSIDPEWQDLKSYEKALKHKYAQRLRKIRAAWEGLTVKELTLEDAIAEKDTLFNLYNQVCKNQSVRIGMLSPDYLVELKRHHQDELRVWAAYEGDQMIAFYSAWVKDTVVDMFYIGFDYERNADLQLYFNILFFGVEQAIRFQTNKLILGRTALDAKARLGCQPRYLSTFLYIKNPLLRNVVTRMSANSSAKEGAWEERHPLKH